MNKQKEFNISSTLNITSVNSSTLSFDLYMCKSCPLKLTVLGCKEFSTYCPVQFPHEVYSKLLLPKKEKVTPL